MVACFTAQLIGGKCCLMFICFLGINLGLSECAARVCGCVPSGGLYAGVWFEQEGAKG